MSSVQRSLIEVAESLARKLGYGSADEAEAALGTHAFSSKVKEAAAGEVAPKSPELPRAFEATGRTEANAARDKAAAVERKGLQNRIERNINKSIDARDLSKYNEPAPYTPSDKPVVRPGESDFAIPPLDVTPDINKKLATGGLAAAVAGSAAMYTGRNADTSFADNDRMQQTEPTKSMEGPVATAPDKGVSGGVRNVADKPAAVNTKQASPQKVENTLDKLDEKVRIFNQRGLETGDFKEQLTEARRVYEEDRDRNRALGLAQLVAQSIARMGAAVEGNKRGRYIGDINSPSVDYEARNAEARADYRDQVSDISARQKEATGEAKYKHEQEVGALERRVRDEQLRYQEQQQNIRAQASETRNDLRSQIATNQNLDKLAEREQVKLQERERAVAQLAGAINSPDQKVQAQIPALVSKAGMEQSEFEQLMEEAPEEKGMLWDSKSQALQSDHIRQSLLAPIQERLKQLQEERRGYANITAGKPQQAASQPAPQQTGGQQQQSPIISVRGPSGQVVQMQQDVFNAKYAGKPSYEIVK